MQPFTPILLPPGTKQPMDGNVVTGVGLLGICKCDYVVAFLAFHLNTRDRFALMRTCRALYLAFLKTIQRACAVALSAGDSDDDNDEPPLGSSDLSLMHLGTPSVDTMHRLCLREFNLIYTNDDSDRGLGSCAGLSRFQSVTEFNLHLVDFQTEYQLSVMLPENVLPSGLHTLRVFGNNNCVVVIPAQVDLSSIQTFVFDGVNVLMDMSSMPTTHPLTVDVRGGSIECLNFYEDYANITWLLYDCLPVGKTLRASLACQFPEFDAPNRPTCFEQTRLTTYIGLPNSSGWYDRPLKKTYCLLANRCAPSDVRAVLRNMMQVRGPVCVQCQQGLHPSVILVGLQIPHFCNEHLRQLVLMVSMRRLYTAEAFRDFILSRLHLV